MPESDLLQCSFSKVSMSYPNLHRWWKLNATLSRISALAPDNWCSPDLDYYQNVNLHSAHAISDV